MPGFNDEAECALKTKQIREERKIMSWDGEIGVKLQNKNFSCVQTERKKKKRRLLQIDLPAIWSPGGRWWCRSWPRCSPWRAWGSRRRCRRGWGRWSAGSAWGRRGTWSSIFPSTGRTGCGSRRSSGRNCRARVRFRSASAEAQRFPGWSRNTADEKGR